MRSIAILARDRFGGGEQNYCSLSIAVVGSYYKGGLFYDEVGLLQHEVGLLHHEVGLLQH